MPFFPGSATRSLKATIKGIQTVPFNSLLPLLKYLYCTIKLHRWWIERGKVQTVLLPKTHPGNISITVKLHYLLQLFPQTKCFQYCGWATLNEFAKEQFSVQLKKSQLRNCKLLISIDSSNNLKENKWITIRSLVLTEFSPNTKCCPIVHAMNTLKREEIIQHTISLYHI